jgi:hypothetical protein
MRIEIKGIGVVAAAAAVWLAGASVMAQAPVARPPAPAFTPQIPPVYSIDLMTPAGVSAVGGQWRYMDAQIVETPALPNAGAQWKKTYDIVPKAGEGNFDDSSWSVVAPDTLKDPRCGGKICFSWYRIRITIPAKIGDADPTGLKVGLVITVDDYAEVSVNGQLPRSLGRPSPATVQGFNMPNRVLLSESAKPGDKFEIAILGINGPISIAPANFVFFRQATLEFFRVGY